MKNFKLFTVALFATVTLSLTSCGSDDDSDSGSNDNNNIWQGPTITFTKANNADWTMEASQDRITDNVWITRANNQGLFNIVLESSDADDDACSGPEPSDTEWAYGTTDDDVSSLTYQPLGDLIGCDFQNVVDGQDIVLHLITDDIYIDFKFTSWTVGPNGGGVGGGGFSYERSTMN